MAGGKAIIMSQLLIADKDFQELMNFGYQKVGNIKKKEASNRSSG